ncbi:Hsp20/alpha crystallin family protein [Methanomassiliicoccus luminyensis]|jgi:HSP20 family molecular chaperone IbpA|uniref:Hsp20/alpha crystallin family protein n=1 Tax=Methanomassiliicoccus luminyensis TaxID=1080712 RepID=UPI000360B36E|nr:Hsp20/alpha crystallin family protein [Methanomassiliicoccus luminyensis]
MATPSTYYLVPEHRTRLSEDRTELIFEQHLPMVRKEDLRVEALDTSLFLNFKAEGSGPMSRCYALPYPVDPSTAFAELRDSVLTVRIRLHQPVGPGVQVEVL